MTGIVQSLIGSFGSVVSAVTDAYFNLVTLLLPGNGTNGAQNNTFLDSSTNNFTITRNGNTTQGTFSPFSQTGWSGFLGSTNYLQTTFSQIFTSSTNFCFETWMYPTATPTQDQFWLCGVISGFFFDGWLDSNRKIQVRLSTSVGSTITSTSTVAINSWTHVALSYDGTNLRLFLNGALDTSVAYTGLSTSRTATAFQIGFNNYPSGARYFDGYMSNYRFSVGTARYTSAFTPSTTPLSSDANTGFLTLQSNRFIDVSSNNRTFTLSGTPSVQAFSPFAPTAAYSAATNGGSGYFDGTGDYVSGQTSSNTAVGTGDFSIEAWVYLASAPSTQANILGNMSSDNTQLSFTITSGRLLKLQSWTTNYVTSSGTVPLNAWTHVVVARSGTTMSLFINGARDGTATVTNNFSSTAAMTSGGLGNNSDYLTGYISGLRMLKGSSAYSASSTTLTIPTAPPTAVTNTQLLLNFTNAGIVDSTAKNDLETVGNAQISTTQSKFGGSSMYFDGTGDTLSLPPSQNNLYINGGNFTLEFWYRFAVVPGTQYFYTVRQDGNNYLYIYATSTGWVFDTYSNSVQGPKITSSSITHDTTTWHHFALVYNNGTYNLYVDGTSVGSQANSSVLTTLNGFAVSLNYYIASRANIDSYVNGYIDDFRITRYARYTANFTPPTAAFALQ